MTCTSSTAQVTYEPQAGAETVAEGWIVPGLVDAHCHLGLDDDGAISDAATEEQAIADRDGGALLIRDCGSAADTAWIQEREDLPRLIRAGRHIARTRRYIRNYAHEVEPEELSAYVAQEAQRGDGWVKLVGDWISRDDGDLTPSFPPEAFAEAIRVAHEHGAKVTAHCFGHDVLEGLLDAGIDCIEHGTGLTPDLVEQMVAGLGRAGPDGDAAGEVPRVRRGRGGEVPDVRRDDDRPATRRRRDTIMAAHEAGVAIYAGSDGGGVAQHGNLSGEVLALARARAVRRAGARSGVLAGAGVARARRRTSARAPRPTSWSTTGTRSRTSRSSRRRRGSCCVADPSAEGSADPDPRLVAALRAAGCVFAEEEAAPARGRGERAGVPRGDAGPTGAR